MGRSWRDILYEQLELLAEKSRESDDCYAIADYTKKMCEISEILAQGFCEGDSEH